MVIQKVIRAAAILLWLPFISMGQEEFRINGNVKGLGNGQQVFLVYDSGNQQIADSVLVQNGVFTFANRVDNPVFASIFLGKNPYVKKLAKGEKMDYFKFFLENSTINMNAPDSLKHIVITGSEGNRLNAELRAMLKENDEKFAALTKSFDALPQTQQKDSLVIDSFVKRENVYMKESFQIHLAFAEKHPDAYLSVISLAHIANQDGMAPAAARAYERLSPKLKATSLAKNIPVILASQELAQIGKMAPDFAQSDPGGKTIRLSDFKNHYVLLDFWASWCGPCRAENPNVRAAYKTYQSKGFQVFGVSLDSPGQKEAWLKAIEADQLTWPQVSDLKGWNNAAAQVYGIRFIPANFLIDPSGKIIARDLRGAELNRKLAEVFKEN